MTSRLIVNSIRHTGSSSDAVTLASDGTCTANLTNRTNRNLIINGAMLVAQRGTSASVTGGYLTIDRFETATGGVDEAPTQAQVDVASGTTPYTSGFRKALKVTNGNQTGGAGATDNIIALRYHAEAQDIANSGWNYTSTSSYVTLSFWIKSSVAQSFQGVLTSDDGTKQIYPFATGSLSADTWTKITKTIPGNSNLTFNNDNGKGLTLEIIGYSGSSYANDSATINAWQARTSGTQFGRASTSTWYTTNDATLEITGVQLEVGSVATDFEHETYSDTLRKCQRYFWRFGGVNTGWIFNGIMANSSNARMLAKFPVPMRSSPTITFNDLVVDAEVSGSVEAISSVANTYFDPMYGGRLSLNCSSSSVGTGASVMLYPNSTSGYLQGDSEL